MLTMHECKSLLPSKMNSVAIVVDEVNTSKEIAEFVQHDDPDVIIPYHISIYLLYSSHLLLVTSIVAVSYGRYSLFAVLFAVYITSVMHWRKPRFSTIARKLDFIAVFAAIAYGSYYSIDRCNQTELIYTWFIGLLIIAVMFTTNEVLYYYQVMKLPTGATVILSHNINKSYHTNDNKSLFCYYFKPTQANTIERDNVYKRTVFIHLLCVHIFANALALTLVIKCPM